jgi:hypothetical protein
MIQVDEHLFVGDYKDAEVILPAVRRRDATWAMISAAKEPFHRMYLGYQGRSAPNTDPEYYSLVRGRHLVLNWVDVDNADFFRHTELLEAAVHYDAACRMQLDTLVHCNKGENRGPSLALYLMYRDVEATLGEAVGWFEAKYPAYDPTPGMLEFLRRTW